MDSLEYVKQTASEPFKWGVNDCAMWAVGLIKQQTGIDVAKPYLGQYSTAFGCKRIIESKGGLLALMQEALQGFEPTISDGVAVAEADGQIICGILIDENLYLKTERGFQVKTDYTLLQGWSCQQR